MDPGEALLSVARRLVDRPEAVRLGVEGPAGEASFLLDVAPEERGKLIGREGRGVGDGEGVAAVKGGERAQPGRQRRPERVIARHARLHIQPPQHQRLG
ncbi:MAG TPA: hypothetical protein PKO05_11035, partial [Thermoanaerobaculia bacterium]|nr:hypothetical protein [Thermoanaerobaculia bacterium]